MSRNEFGVFGWGWGIGGRESSGAELEEDGAWSEGPISQGQKHAE